jgi:membrane-associated phospholipid phosphatase
MTETAPTRRPRLTDVPSSTPEAGRERESLGYAWRLWAVVVLFGAIVLARSAAIGVPVRDPDGQMFQDRILKAFGFLVAIALAEAVLRSGRRWWRPVSVWRTLRERWSSQRIVLVATGLLAYHLVYLGYRNLKSWNAFNPLRDDDLLELDKALFLGHSPAVVLHSLFGEAGAADFFALVYRSFTYVIVLALIGTLALVPSVRKGYVFLCAATYAWILGTLSYYLLPSLGPYATAPWEFDGLRATKITETQAEYLTERAHFLANPAAPDAFVSLGAFASLHVGFSTLVFLMTRYYGLKRVSRVMGIYLVLVVISTVYFGWHYVSDDIAGALLAASALALGHWTVHPRWRRAPS